MTEKLRRENSTIQAWREMSTPRLISWAALTLFFFGGVVMMLFVFAGEFQKTGLSPVESWAALAVITVISVAFVIGFAWEGENDD